MNNEAKNIPPAYAVRFLRWFCPRHLLEEIEGDLFQKFNHDLVQFDRKKARRRFLWNVIRLFRPGILMRNKFQTDINQIPMFRNYFKTTYRHILKSKVNFSFKLGGLTLALASVLIIAVYVSYQLSFDRFHEGYENIYRVNSEWMENGNIAKYALAPSAVGPALKEEFPEIKAFTRIGSSRYLIKYKETSYRFEGFTNADSTVFDVFSFDFVRGNRHAMDNPKAIILTESLARQIFGDEDPMRKEISFTDRSNQVFEVTGIIRDMPSNTHLSISALMPHQSLRDSFEIAMDPWGINIDGSTELYLKLEKGRKAEELASKAEPFLRSRLTKTEEGVENSYSISLTPLKDIYLAPRIYAEFCKKGNAVYIYIFSLLGVFLIVMAGINYVNLSIADFHKRSKEIGVRKVLGARKRQIAFQVVTEASLICITALLLSVGILYMIFPQVLQIIDSNLRFTMLFDTNMLLWIGSVLVFLVVLTTVYPAYRLSVNKPVNDFKKIASGGKKASISNGLLLAQFTISVICICATFFVGRQIEFIQKRNPGYDRENLLVLAMPDRYPDEKIPVIKEELSRLPGVEAVSYSTFRIAGAGYYRDWYRVEIKGEMKKLMLNEVFFDHDFFKAANIPFVAGRPFDPAMATDAHSAFIVNETAVKEFGWDDAIGKRISYGFDDASVEKWEGAVVGVVKDFNVYSFHKKIEPLVMRLPWSSWPGNCVHIKINGPLDQTIASIKKKYEEILPDFLVDYRLIEDIYNDQYKNETKAYSTLQVSTWIVVLISSLGIFSLSVYMSAARMKEFGVRKVFGASVRQIALLHVGQFLRIAVLANLIGLPVSFWAMRTWLSEFAYKTDLNVIVFFIVGVLSLLLVTASAGYSSWKAGRMNPIDVIKQS